MTAPYLTRKPNARGSSVEWRRLRDEKVAQLRAETKAAKLAQYSSPQVFYAGAREIRAGRAMYNPEAC